MEMINMVKNNPQGMFNDLMQNNPQFRQFYETNKNKSIDQLINDSGLGTFANLFK